MSIGDRAVSVDDTSYLAHRLAYLYVYGEMPEGKLDHKDQDKTNNAISNLRPATNSQNGLNRGLPANNKSGHKGVHWSQNAQKWVAYIKIDRKRRHLGCFDNIEDAISARKAAEESLGISEFCPQ